MTIERLVSDYDRLTLEAAVFVAETPRAVVCFSHGMAEHKERYYPFLEYLCAAGLTCIIHDHRGHGASVRSPEDLGYFYTTDCHAVVSDLCMVIRYARKQFPGLPVFLFAHSMGTLVARCFLQNYDSLVDRVVLCGPPTRNAAVDAGLLLARAAAALGLERKPNALLNTMAFGSFNRGEKVPNSWLSVNRANVAAYNRDPLCGYVFTTNGFINLLELQKQSFAASGWQITRPELPILVIGGSQDPCIGSEEKFRDLLDFLRKVGWQKVDSRLYPGLRHEILNEDEKDRVYRDVCEFFLAGTAGDGLEKG